MNDDPTYKRKVQELYLATKLEKIMTKDEILEAYLNIIYLGDSNYGVKTAAQDYFGKDLDNDKAFLENVVSRKKQLLPNILGVIGDRHE